MFDTDTVIVTYDAARGEPRGSAHARMGSEKSGDCIDCSMCVQVCPTGIDIRKGLQYECIGCAACVDACNGVMDKVNRPRGLIRYATENALAAKLSPGEVRRRVLRPRVMVYTAVLAILGTAMLTSLALRNPLKLDVIRDRGSMGREVEDGMIENVYRLQVMNTTEEAQRLYITVDGIASAKVADEDVVEIGAATTRAVPVRVRIAGGDGQPGSNRIAFTLASKDSAALQVTEEAAFIVPK
jgi:cytochrome c oxidase accessory protein FixG